MDRSATELTTENPTKSPTINAKHYKGLHIPSPPQNALQRLKMTLTRIVNLRKERFEVYIGRGSKWGNPFVIGKHGDRDQVVQLYRDYLMTTPELIEDLGSLKGKTLGCYCKPAKCHGDILIELIESTL
jgi:hypothetical protein